VDRVYSNSNDGSTCTSVPMQAHRDENDANNSMRMSVIVNTLSRGDKRIENKKYPNNRVENKTNSKDTQQSR